MKVIDAILNARFEVLILQHRHIWRGNGATMSYPGGKGGAGVYQRIINEMPPHAVYIEPFLGGGSVMLNKRPARLNIGCDLDAEAASECWRKLMQRRDTAEYQITKADAFEILERYPWQGDELVYLDPPYLLETRASRRAIYAHELVTREDHARLLRLVCALPCRVMLSGYPSQLYAATLRDWRVIRFTATTRGGTATECLWCNFERPEMLHDPSYLGDGYRERERIRRKARRWKAGLDRLDPLERQAILSALAPLFEDYAPLVEQLADKQEDDAKPASVAAE